MFRNIRDRLSVLFRKSRAMRAWSGGRTILDHGLLTATPVCVGERRDWGIVNRNFLVTEAIPDALDIGCFITKKFQSYGEFQNIIEKRKFIYQCGRTIGKMHHLGIFQGDLRAGNIIIQEARARPLIINLIDNERTRIYRKLPDRKRLKNLVQVNMVLNPEITRADRVRFFYAYLEENPNLCHAKKVWMQRVLNKTQKRLMSKQRLVQGPTQQPSPSD
jgi:hypothetical protein